MGGYLSRRGLVLDGQVELELGWELILRVEPVREVHSANPTVCMDLGERETYFLVQSLYVCVYTFVIL